MHIYWLFFGVDIFPLVIPPPGVIEMQICTTPAKRARIAKQLRQVDLAHAVGISQPHLSNIETMRKPASPAIAARLALELGINELQILYPERYMPTASVNAAAANR